MKRLLFAVFALPLIFALLSTAVIADEPERDADLTASIADIAGVDGLEGGHITADELSGSKSVNIFEKLLEIISESLTKNGGSLMSRFGLLLASVVFCGLMSALKFGLEGLDRASGYITLLVVSAAAYSLMYDLFIFVTASMESLTLAMTSLLPVTSSLYAMGGNPGAAAASASGLMIFLTVLQAICTKILLPLLRVTFALSLAGAMPGSVDLSPVTSLVRTTATTVLSFLFTLLGFALYLQTAVSAAGDSYLTRSVRFASGVFVPVIGSMLGDAFRTVAASVGVVKGVVGGVGVTLILSAIIPPIVVVLIYRIMLTVCAVTAKALGCENEGKLLTSLTGLTGILTALTAGSGAVCLIAMAAFVRIQ